MSSNSAGKPSGRTRTLRAHPESRHARLGRRTETDRAIEPAAGACALLDVDGNSKLGMAKAHGRFTGPGPGAGHRRCGGLCSVLFSSVLTVTRPAGEDVSALRRIAVPLSGCS